MNSLKSNLIILTSLIVGLASSCGKSNNTNTQGQINPGYPGYPGQPGYPGTGQCIPITGNITFAAQNIYMDYANLVGGQIPFAPQAVGSIITGGAYTQPVVAGGQQLVGMGSDGNLQMIVSSAQMVNTVPYTNYPQQSQFPSSQQYWGTQPPMQGNQLINATGSLQLSQLVIQDIVYKVQTGQIQIPGLAQQVYNGYPQTTAQINPQSICVSAIAINVGRYYGRIYGGNVYLYLNGTSHGYRMMF
jgi:hypothetical protein